MLQMMVRTVEQVRGLDLDEDRDTKKPFKEVFELFIDHFKSHEAQNEVKNQLRKFLQAAYTLDINRALHGSKVPIATSFQKKLKL